MNPLTALLLTTTHCPHCRALKQLLQAQADKYAVQLEVVNLEQQPEVAQQYGVRSVPWLKLGEFVFHGGLTSGELESWIKLAARGEGMSSYLASQLTAGKLNGVLDMLAQGNAKLADLLPMLSDPETPLSARIGVSAVMEHYEAKAELAALLPSLVELSTVANPAVRIDACHYLSLTHDAGARDALAACLKDDEVQVREAAQEALDDL